MDVIKTLRLAINYIEENIDETISLNDIASNTYTSVYHFHRTFKTITGISPMEYVRNRKLALSAEDLSTRNVKVVDVALKYGYESQSGFEKAFYRFHGVTPGRVKKGNVNIKSYHPLKINISIEGGNAMDYKIINLEQFELAVLKKKFNLEETSKDDNNDIPEFWKHQSMTGGFSQLMKVADERPLYGVCEMIDDDSMYFNYGIGVKSSKPEGMDTITIEKGTYAVFKVKKQEDFGPVWDSITKEFLVNSNYERLSSPDLEYYPENKEYFAEVWIPVKEK